MVSRAVGGTRKQRGMVAKELVVSGQRQGPGPLTVARRAATHKPKITITADLERLEKHAKPRRLLVPPPRNDYTPYVFNNLGPYCDITTAKFLVKLPDIRRRGYYIRQLASGLTDPWRDLTMDRELLPQIDTTPDKKAVLPPTPRPLLLGETRKTQGSTRMPPIPMVTVATGDIKKTLCYSDVPSLRKQLKKKMEANEAAKNRNEYQRTRADFYRMGLYRLDEIHPANRDWVKKSYATYFQNTAGARRAIKHCMEEVEAEIGVKPGGQNNIT